MQTLVVMLIGFTYLAVGSSSTVLVYLALGAIGAPFAGGLAYMSGPTGGYHLWFPRSSISYRLLYKSKGTYFY